LDGEESATERETLDAHLATCAPCRRFSDEAARVTRLARTAVAVPEPDVVRAVLASAPPYRRPRLSAALRVLLGLVGLAQAEVALAEILGAHAGGAGSEGVVLQGASVAHFAHESAAWNFALGVGFLWVAWRSSRTSGMVPTLATFVTVLTVLVVMDVMAGGVDVARLAIHGLVVLGLILVIALDRLPRPVGPVGGTVPGVAAVRWCRANSSRLADPAVRAGTEGAPPNLQPSAQHGTAASQRQSA
jgi:predicted anti-sigma-YlaC factor YlaD